MIYIYIYNQRTILGTVSKPPSCGLADWRVYKSHHAAEVYVNLEGCEVVMGHVEKSTFSPSMESFRVPVS